MTGEGRKGDIGYMGQDEPDEPDQVELEESPEAAVEDAPVPDEDAPVPDEDTPVPDEDADRETEPETRGGAAVEDGGESKAEDRRGAEITDLQMAELLEIRAREPGRIRDAAANRTKRPLLRKTSGLFIIAADHSSGVATGAGSNATATADRRELLTRLLTALEQPGVDGVLATPDIIEDLLLLDALDDRIAIGSMNRGGIAPAAWEPEGRFTAFDAEAIRSAELDGGSMLVRLDSDDPATADTLESCARAITALAGHELPAFVEPQPLARGSGGKLSVSTDADALTRAALIAAALGSTSAYTWLKIPVVEAIERVIAATTLPILLVGGDPGDGGKDASAGLTRALAYPQARGLIAGRDLLYPSDGDVVRAVRAAAKMVHG